jgi:hypothetical protein
LQHIQVTHIKSLVDLKSNKNKIEKTIKNNKQQFAFTLFFMHFFTINQLVAASKQTMQKNKTFKFGNLKQQQHRTTT